MKKKVLASLLCLSMAATLFAGCGSSNGGNGTESGKSKSGSDKKVTIWSAESVSKLTEELATKWVKENYPDYSVEVQSVGETDAAKNVITDVDGAADIYGIAQDQLARLVAAGALQPLTDEYKTWVTDNNDSGASTAATIDSMTYAFPMTSDNGYFLIYDKSIISDPSNLDQILKDCEDNGKQFYYEFTSAWYNAAVYLGAGAECTFDIDKEGNFTKANTNYASPEGVVALRKLIDIANSPATVDASALTAITDTQNVGAFVGGAWTINDSKETKDPDGEPDSGDEESYVAPGLKTILGDNFACAKLPSFTGSDGKSYQMSGFGGFKLMGIKPQKDAEKLKLCYELTKYLTDTDAQLQRYNTQGWGPSNVTAQQDSAVQSDVALTALREQLELMVPQGQYPNDWWDLAGDLIKTGDGDGYLTKDATDDQLMEILKNHDDTCASYCQ